MQYLLIKLKYVFLLFLKLVKVVDFLDIGEIVEFACKKDLRQTMDRKNGQGTYISYCIGEMCS